MSMGNIDITKLRKMAAMSQRELAALLQVRPSFLSAIENGRSRLPEEKQEKLKEIFELDNLDDYIIEDEHDEAVVPPHVHLDGQDTLTQLLTHMHDLAHQRDKSHLEEAERLDYLSARCDRLSQRVDDLRDEVDALRAENLRLKELLIKGGLSY